MNTLSSRTKFKKKKHTKNDIRITGQTCPQTVKSTAELSRSTLSSFLLGGRDC